MIDTTFVRLSPWQAASRLPGKNGDTLYDPCGIGFFGIGMHDTETRDALAALLIDGHNNYRRAMSIAGEHKYVKLLATNPIFFDFLKEDLLKPKAAGKY